MFDPAEIYDERELDEQGLEYADDQDGDEELHEEDEEVDENSWTSLHKHPVATQQALYQLLQTLKNAARDSITIMFVGKSGVGKSSTINSLLAEKVVQAARAGMSYGPPTARTTHIVRSAANFTLHLIDTPPLLFGDSINAQAFSAIENEIAKRGPVDVVVYVDTLTSYRIDETDRSVLRELSTVFGRSIWPHVVIGLTHGQLTSPAGGLTYEEFRDKRVAQLRQAMAKSGAPDANNIPAVVIENSERCNKAQGSDERILPDGTAWVKSLIAAAVDICLSHPVGYAYDPANRRRSSPNRKHLWLIPLVLAAQYFLKRWLDNVTEIDGCYGDVNGPFDEDMVAEELDKLAERKEEMKLRNEEQRENERKRRDREAQRAQRDADRAQRSSFALQDDDEDEDEDEDDDF